MNGTLMIALVTSPNSTLGKEIIKTLQKKNYQIIVPKTNKHAALTNRIEVIPFKVNSLKSIRDFARFVKNKYKKIDVLINNIDVYEKKFLLTTDRIEQNLASNFIHPFLLINLLLPMLGRAENAKIINITSNIYKEGVINYDDIEFRSKFNSLKSYAQSKLAILLMTKELSRLCMETRITVVAVGVPMKNIFHDTITKLFSKAHRDSNTESLKTIEYLITSQLNRSHSGEYFQNMTIHRSCIDYADIEKVWNIAKDYTQ